jgi:hypothetical protein
MCHEKAQSRAQQPGGYSVSHRMSYGLNLMTESFAELFEQSLASQSLKPGTIITGTVVEIRDDAVVVNAGLKSEGIVPIYQFRSLSGELEVEVGDSVEVSLEAVEDGYGETRLSREKAKRAMVWDKLENAFEGRAKSAEKSKVALRLISTISVHSCQDHWWMYVRFVIPLTLKVRIWISKSSNWTVNAIT